MAMRTPANRKLTSTACGHMGFCAESYGGDKTSKANATLRKIIPQLLLYYQCSLIDKMPIICYAFIEVPKLIVPYLQSKAP